ncbi:BnaA09g39510D [Brassica napus]|uniref:Cation efflux protein cytoplasmic domain-containing protein n=2 Tax=Brassica TaxID=3705 RepID=M4CTU9_BRACM|nr:unnamed protein product [Brassica napus]CDY11385.1 BnaA09g39510D [Brassica napus]VDC63204.1 unnamed protein product [Brassica rapa]
MDSTRNKVCGETSCVFSTSPSDAKERSASMRKLSIVVKGLLETEEVVSVHELHIWAITVGKVLFSCHVKIKQESDDAMVLNKVIDYIRREYRISHVTIQIER